MAATTNKYVAGAYSVTWNSLDLGYTEAGFELTINKGDIVPVQEDRHGVAIVDGVIQQIESMFVRIETLYFNKDVWAAAFPELTALDSADANGRLSTTAGDLIVRSEKAKVLLLTPKTGIAKVAVIPAKPKWSFYFAWPVDPIPLLFAARDIRRVPINFQLFPNTDIDSDDSIEADWYKRETLV